MPTKKISKAKRSRKVSRKSTIKKSIKRSVKMALAKSSGKRKRPRKKPNANSGMAHFRAVAEKRPWASLEPARSLSAVGTAFQCVEVKLNPFTGNMGPKLMIQSRVYRNWSLHRASLRVRSIESKFSRGSVCIAYVSDMRTELPTSYESMAGLYPNFKEYRLADNGSMTMVVGKVDTCALGTGRNDMRVLDPDETNSAGRIEEQLAYGGKFFIATFGVGSEVLGETATGVIAHIDIGGEGEFEGVRVDAPSEQAILNAKVVAVTDVSAAEPFGSDPQVSGSGVGISYTANLPAFALVSEGDIVIDKQRLMTLAYEATQMILELTGTNVQALVANMAPKFEGDETASATYSSIINAAGTAGKYIFELNNKGNAEPNKVAPSGIFKSIVDFLPTIAGAIAPGGSLISTAVKWGASAIGSLFSVLITAKSEVEAYELICEFYATELLAHRAGVKHYFGGIPRRHLPRHLWSSKLCAETLRGHMHLVDFQPGLLINHQIRDYSAALECAKARHAATVCCDDDEKSVVDSDFCKGVKQSPMVKIARGFNKLGLTVMLCLCLVTQCFAISGTVPAFMSSVVNAAVNRPSGGCLSALPDTASSGPLSQTSFPDYVDRLGVFTTAVITALADPLAVAENCCYITSNGSPPLPLAIACALPGQSTTISVNDVGGMGVSYGYTNTALHAGRCCFTSFTHIGTTYDYTAYGSVNPIPIDIKKVSGQSLPATGVSAAIPVSPGYWNGVSWSSYDLPVNLATVDGYPVANDDGKLEVEASVAHWNATASHISVNIDSIGGIKHDSSDEWIAPYLPTALRYVGEKRIQTERGCAVQYSDPKEFAECQRSVSRIPVTTLYSDPLNGLVDTPLRVEDFSGVPKFFTKSGKARRNSASGQ